LPPVSSAIRVNRAACIVASKYSASLGTTRTCVVPRPTAVCPRVASTSVT
jgi:hypothetical protein